MIVIRWMVFDLVSAKYTPWHDFLCVLAWASVIGGLTAALGVGVGGGLREMYAFASIGALCGTIAPMMLRQTGHHRAGARLLERLSAVALVYAVASVVMPLTIA